MKNFLIKLVGLQFVSILLSVCLICAIAIAENGEKLSEEAELEAVAKPGKEPAAEPVAESVIKPTAKPGVETAAKPEEEAGSSLKDRMQKRISIEFRNTPIEDALMLMADQADVDIVKSPSVTGSVTVKLTDVPLGEALDNILAAHGYGYAADKNMIRVAPASEISHVAERIISRIYTITYANVKEVETALRKFLSKEGTLSSSPGTSNIIVSDTESKIKAMDEFIDVVDRMTPQILVEARIYDITSTENFDMGVAWQIGRNVPLTDITSEKTYNRTDTTSSATYSQELTESWDDPVEWQEHLDYLAGTSPTDGTPSERKVTINEKPATEGYSTTDTKDITEDSSKSWRQDDQGEYLPYSKSKPFFGGKFEPEGGGTLRFGLLDNNVDIDLTMSMLKKQVGAKLLANPRILVLDNETAKIDIVTEIPYQQLSQGGQQSFGTTSFKKVGVTLEVTPHISERDGMVRLKLKPTFSVRTGTVDVGDPTQGVKYPQPVIDTREADTTLLIMNGQTVILGGMRKRETTQNVRKVPMLGDLPLVNGLFRYESEYTVTSEIVVFITPHIIQQPVMSELENRQYGVTEFKGPEPVNTRAEKSNK